MLVSWMVTLSTCQIWQIISSFWRTNMVVYTLEQLWEKVLRAYYRRFRFWQKKIIFSDETHFEFGGFVNKQNYRIWGIENPLAYIEKPTHPKRVTVWCGFRSRGISALFFFANKQGEDITVNGDNCRAMFNKFLFTKIEEEDIGNIWFQQDGATYHTDTRSFAPCFWRSHYQPQS